MRTHARAAHLHEIAMHDATADIVERRGTRAAPPRVVVVDAIAVGVAARQRCARRSNERRKRGARRWRT